MVEDVGSILDLVKLDAGVDEDADVVHDEANDLDGVFEAQGVPDEDELVEVPEDEDGEIGGDGAGFRVDRGGKMDVGLELAKDVRLEGDADDGLEDGGQHEGPCPAGARPVHSGGAADGRREGGGEALAVVVAPRPGVEVRL